MHIELQSPARARSSRQCIPLPGSRTVNVDGSLLQRSWRSRCLQRGWKQIVRVGLVAHTNTRFAVQPRKAHAGKAPIADVNSLLTFPAWACALLHSASVAAMAASESRAKDRVAA